MSREALLHEIESLPVALQKRVEEFVVHLKREAETPPARNDHHIQLGVGQGGYTVKANFDDPIPGLEGFQ